MRGAFRTDDYCSVGKLIRETEPAMRYSVYESSAFGSVRAAAVLEATSDRDALRQARDILPNGAVELREDGRIVCRFGRAGGFLLQI